MRELLPVFEKCSKRQFAEGRLQERSVLGSRFDVHGDRLLAAVDIRRVDLDVPGATFGVAPAPDLETLVTPVKPLHLRPPI